MNKFFQPTLFDASEFIDTCRRENIKNNTHIISNMRDVEKRRLRYENLHLSKGMSYTCKNGFPQIMPYNGEIPPFSKIYP